MTIPEVSRATRWFTRVMAVLVLGISLYGFGGKFIEFVWLFWGDPEGMFAISPMTNYLLASMGFLCMFFWAMSRGTFHDVERPKYNMLETEELLDAQARMAARQQRPNWQ